MGILRTLQLVLAGATLFAAIPALAADECAAASAAPTLESLSASIRDAGYVGKSAADKQAALFAAVESSRYATNPKIEYGALALGWRLIKGFASLGQFFDSPGDALSPRDKIFHPFGTVAKVTFVPVAGTPYTGMFAERSLGVMRLSLGADDKSWISGAAIKFLADGRDSVNLVGIPNADPQKTRDFFEGSPTNDLPEPKSWAVRAGNLALGLIANPSKRPTDNLARVTPDGRTVANPKFPEKIFLRPMLHQDPASTADVRDQLGAIPTGTTVYEMWAKNADGTDTKLGDVKTTSPFVASGFGDHVLYFRHNR